MTKLTPKQENIIDSLGYDSPTSFLNHTPYRYDILENKPVEQWQEGDNLVFFGELMSGFQHIRLRGKQVMTHFQVFVEGEVIKVTIFNRPFLKAGNYNNGITVIGTVSKNGSIVAKSVTNTSLEENLGIKPMYPLKAGIKNYEIVRLIKKLLQGLEILNIIPDRFIKDYRLENRRSAMIGVHTPNSMNDVHRALRTLKYEEFLRYHLHVALNSNTHEFGIAKNVSIQMIQNELNNLPYTLTSDQEESLHDILDDIHSQKQMNRLLQGDVGSGKTVVAFLAAVAVIKAGYQVAFLVPTDILLYQHVRSFQKMFPDMECHVLAQSVANREERIAEIKESGPSLIIGTHTLFSEDVVYNKLGLVIIDEQHRFGVKQRQAMIQKGEKTDTLMLSATPIPRTLATSLFFDLDVSTIASYPSHRQKIETHLIPENSIRTILSELTNVVKNKGQIYVVCPAISEGERPNVKYVEGIYDQLSNVFSGYTVEMIHGKINDDQRKDIMNRFVEGKIDILVSTTVIEVGVDVHNANTMIIYNAEQFGLATLHQLRGRVGRGTTKGVCYLLSSSDQEESKQRLESLSTHDDGFELSMIDLRMRGMGDALGTRQSGLPSFIFGDIENDEKILRQAKLDAQTIISDLSNPDYKRIIELTRKQDYIKTI
ncbi:ATP-dependent DNA helicase RecG [Erysipelothrix sp. HDW6A]|uniref:ATP-dependent DNA helicase RecG n=1 Tax=Erysipelothrix sp. HDW6A TaxID=2714928 RepID=UPI00140A0114|nr:ATP-dependent DNA helicase RecG [Erysipelothrix sp. HDW6A]QIK57491.1 ATP-dependent DNA helicase RecG [Erysipelothrix sp. HDW6A]